MREGIYAGIAAAMETLAARRRPAAQNDEREGVRDWRLGQVVKEAAEPPLELASCALSVAQLAQLIAARGGKAHPEAPFVIEHREALIYMLCEAAELEHGLVAERSERAQGAASSSSIGGPMSKTGSSAGRVR